MKMKRIISTFLVVLMLASAFTMIVSAEGETTPVYEFNTNRVTPTMDYTTGVYEYVDEEGKTQSFKVTTPEQKLETMDLRFEKDGHRIYVDAFSGEVAIQNIATGDVMFSNPYDVSSRDIQEDKKAEYLSQILITFADTSMNGTSSTYTSYKDAVKGGDYKNETASQIQVKYIKNGIRVEYSIGRIDSRYLVPHVISVEKFKTEILDVVKAATEGTKNEWEFRTLNGFFELKDLEKYVSLFKNNPEKAAEQREKYIKENPTFNYVDKFYQCTALTKREFKSVEGIIKKYCPDYTFEDLDEEYLELNYTPDATNDALFSIALEYTVDTKGFTVRVPANGIRFDESVFRLDNIEILPYMGVGHNPNSGYIFYPDGSGTLFDFEEAAKRSTETYFHGTVYGEDFAYHNIGTSAPHNEPIRYPVFGLKEDIVDEDGNERSRGYVAIVEDGDALMKLSAYLSAHYNTVRMKVSPRPYDTYKLSQSISVGSSAPFTVVSERKYTGDFKVRYIMLTDPSVKTGEGYYDPSYVGMAKAYRDYLIANKTLTKLTNVGTDIPLYIETFGAIETVEKFLSIPYDTMKALTSFDDISKMYKELSEADIKNINFILTGYNKGGLSVDQMPYRINWDNSVEKEMDFEELLAYAKKEGFGLYPDFDFVFVGDNKMFDGLSLREHAVKTVDDRYTSKREYSATRQTFVSYFELAMSPAYFSRFYEKLTKTYGKYEPIGISVSTLGTYLNSDFDEDEPYHREDSKDFTVDAFKYFDEHYSKVMTSGGNAYTWKYVDYITDISIDSSRHARSCATVPFLGIVLHGFVQTAGEPVNMEGNIDYAMLRAIENGTALQFILSYRNTEKLKEGETTSAYYSVRYDIWVEDLIARYNEINAALKDVQTSTIEVHEFIDGLRIPYADEIEQDAEKELFEAINKEIEDAAANKESVRVMLQTVRKNLNDWQAYAAIDNASSAAAIYATVADKLTALENAKTALDAADLAVKAAEDALAAAPAPTAEGEGEGEGTPEEPTLEEKLAAAKEEQTKAFDAMKVAYNDYVDTLNKAAEVADEYIEKYEYARDNFAELANNSAFTENIRNELKVILDGQKAAYDALIVLKGTIDAEITTKPAVVTELETKYAEELGLNAKQEEEKGEDVVVPTYNKYAAAKNSIVYERYSNGKTFILNFNNYAVKVQVDGVYYTVGAYGYIVIS